MQQQLQAVETPIQAIIRQTGLEQPTSRYARVWARMDRTQRAMMLRAANLPAACACWHWEQILPATRKALSAAADRMALPVRGLSS